MGGVSPLSDLITLQHGGLLPPSRKACASETPVSPAQSMTLTQSSRCALDDRKTLKQKTHEAVDGSMGRRKSKDCV
jgi:hypothetical protein